MMILTFTNKAAEELKERLSLEEEDMPLLGTFHHAAMTLLKEYLDVGFIGFTKEFELILPEDELVLANELILTNGLKIKYKNRLAKRLESEKRPKYKDDLPKLRILLKEEKQKKNVMSYDDLIFFATELLSKRAFLALDTTSEADRKSLHISYILVDEVQDCDEKQLEFSTGFHGKVSTETICGRRPKPKYLQLSCRAYSGVLPPEEHVSRNGTESAHQLSLECIDIRSSKVFSAKRQSVGRRGCKHESNHHPQPL